LKVIPREKRWQNPPKKSSITPGRGKKRRGKGWGHTFHGEKISWKKERGGEKGVLRKGRVSGKTRKAPLWKEGLNRQSGRGQKGKGNAFRGRKDRRQRQWEKEKGKERKVLGKKVLFRGNGGKGRYPMGGEEKICLRGKKKCLVACKKKTPQEKRGTPVFRKGRGASFCGGGVVKRKETPFFPGRRKRSEGGPKSGFLEKKRGVPGSPRKKKALFFFLGGGTPADGREKKKKEGEKAS